MESSEDARWRDALKGLDHGDFSRLEPLFSLRADTCLIVQLFENGYFDDEPKLLAEALTCACFLGKTRVVEFFLNQGVDPSLGTKTGMSALHWAANRGNLDTVKLLIEWRAPLEQENMYGGTVLGCTVWSAINERRPDHLRIIETLIEAGANLSAVDYPTGSEQIDELLRRHRKKP